MRVYACMCTVQVHCMMYMSICILYPNNTSRMYCGMSQTAFSTPLLPNLYVADTNYLTKVNSLCILSICFQVASKQLLQLLAIRDIDYVCMYLWVILYNVMYAHFSQFVDGDY